MKRLLFVGVLFAGCMSAVDQSQQPVQRRQNVPARPEARHVRAHGYRMTSAERDFNNLQRRNAQRLDRQVRQAYDNRDAQRLGDLARLARQFAAQVHSGNNVHFESALDFNRRFSRIAQKAERYRRTLLNRNIQPVPLDARLFDSGSDDEPMR